MLLLILIVSGISFNGAFAWENLNLGYSAGIRGFASESSSNNVANTRNLAYGSLNPDGSYSFGFNADDHSRQESADANNNVQGSYSYKNPAGTHDLSYVAGAETGFKPTGGSLAVPNDLPDSSSNNVGVSTPTAVQTGGSGSLAYGSLNPDGSYSYGFNTGDQSRQESADANNNVQGSYSYKNSAGTHDLSYVAGAETGFKATGGSLSVPNGLPGTSSNNVGGSPSALAQTGDSVSPPGSAAGTLAYGSLNPDGSYSFGFTTDEQSRQESADANNNVQGSYSYKNSAGTHDLSYVAGAETGFKATGGSLSVPPGLSGTDSNNVEVPSPTVAQTIGSDSPSGNAAETLAYGSLNPDGSYSFGFNTGEQSRQESADANNNVQGNYSYKNSAGTHDLSYVAGAETGFKTTGGSLSVPNGLSATSSNSFGASPSTVVQTSDSGSPSGSAAGTLAYGSLNRDGSYSFEFNTDDQTRQESADANNNVQGSYSYKNSAGTHDLSYVAGAETGFKAIRGSLSIPNGLSGTGSNNVEVQSPTTAQTVGSGSPSGTAAGTLAHGSLNSDGSYSFGFTTDEQSRQESADANNNVQGSYSYKNSAGTHDLSYVAGAETGFKATGGSLSVPNGLPGISSNKFGASPSTLVQTSDSGSPSGNTAGTLAYGSLKSDGSYSFGFNTDDQTRQESADANNNVQGSYSYKNSAGTHDLSYVAGAETGFKATGGSLSVPNGLSGTSSNNVGSSPSTLAHTGNSGSQSGDAAGTLAYGSLNRDGSYSFGFNTDGQSRQESADANNNVQGSYWYKNSAGTHDLSYVAGAETGFKTTGGSLSIPNGLPGTSSNNVGASPSTLAHTGNSGSPSGSAGGTLAHGSLNPDGSYSFRFNTDDQSRQESADANNNVQGSYWYKNSAGTHDLSYVAGAETGFKTTGGSLSIPNGLPGTSSNNVGASPSTLAQTGGSESPSGNAVGALAYGSLNPDGSYSFGFNTGDQSRQESADANNNVQGSYWYKNSAGTHDLSYVAGADTGFKPTGGSLSVPNGL